MSRTRNWISPIVALAVLAGGCKKAETSAGTVDTAGVVAVVPAADSAAASQTAELQAQKDSLIGVTRSLLGAMASIDSATSLAGKKATHSGEPIKSYEADVRDRTVAALKSLRSTRARLNTISARVKSLGGENADLKAQVDEFTRTVSALQSQLATSQTRADSLVRQLYAANIRIDSLAYRTQQLGYTIDSTAYESHRVFVVSGTADYLVKHGIVNKVGGSRFPFIVKIGETIRPANTHPDTTLFRAFDMTALTTVPVDTTKTYEVISAQDLSGADRSDAKGRVFHGPIHITDPKTFWRPSPYLILLIP
ncbi:MAG: bZIP transcription factor [Gemmatimonadaceae bacterium]